MPATITPASGVPATQVDDFDEDTPAPVELPITPTTIPKRAQTVPGVVLTREPATPRSSARRALEEIRKLGEKLEQHTESDNENLQQINTTLLDLTKSVGDTKTEIAKVATTLEIREEQEERIREDERMRARAQVELELAQKQHSLKETAASRAFKRKILLKALSWLAPIFTALGGAVAIAVHRGCGH